MARGRGQGANSLTQFEDFGVLPNTLCNLNLSPPSTLTNMPHGDPSDITGLALLASGVQLILFPGVVKSTKWIHERFSDDSTALEDSKHAELVGIIGALYILVAFTLFTVCIRRTFP
jgi:hypothetical protein